MIEVVRARRQSIIIGDDIEITVLSTSGDSVRIGIQAPREVPVFRKEIYVETVARAEGRIRVENADDAA